MRDPISFAFNPQADNAFETLEQTISEYSQNILDKASIHKSKLQSDFNWIKEFDSKFKYNFVNLTHFNGKISISASHMPLHDTVHEVSSLIRREEMVPKDYDNVITLNAAVA